MPSASGVHFFGQYHSAWLAPKGPQLFAKPSAQTVVKMKWNLALAGCQHHNGGILCAHRLEAKIEVPVPSAPLLSPSSPPQTLFDLSLTVPECPFPGRVLFSPFNIAFKGGEWTCLLGASGSGKSTLLRMIAGLHQGAQAQLTVSDGAPLAGRLSFMAQTDLLLPWQTVLDNVVIGDRLRGLAPDLDRARTLLEAAGLSDCAARPPRTLSGGQRQRVALVRTLYEDRPVVLMDEPFSALDPVNRLKLQDLAAELLADRTVILVTHDPLEALRLADRILMLRGTPARPHDLFTQTGTPQTGPPPAGNPLEHSPRPRDVSDPALMALQGKVLSDLRDAP